MVATPQEARDKKAWVRSLQIGPQQALAYLEQFWGRELQSYDPDGPLPEIDPVVEETSETRGSGFHGAKARQLADQWRAEAKEKGFTIRKFVSSKTSRVDATFNGSYTEVADRLVEYARTGAVDGFNISPWLVPTGLDDIVNHLVPELQERGIYPTEYAGQRCGKIWDSPHQCAPTPGLPAQLGPGSGPGPDMRDRAGWLAGGTSVEEHDGGALVRLQLTVWEQLL